MSMATMSARGTMTSSTVRSSSFRTFCRILRSASEKSAASALSLFSSSSSRSSRSDMLLRASKVLMRPQMESPREGAGLDGGSGETTVCSLSVIVQCAASRRLLSFVIGVGNAQGPEYLDLEALHLKGVCLVDVIIAEDMEKSMHHQMGDMMDEGLVHVFGFALLC